MSQEVLELLRRRGDSEIRPPGQGSAGPLTRNVTMGEIRTSVLSSPVVRPKQAHTDTVSKTVLGAISCDLKQVTQLLSASVSSSVQRDS